MKTHSLLLCALLTFFWAGCTSKAKQEEKALLEQARQAHQEAYTLHAEVKKMSQDARQMEEELRNRIASIEVQGRALMPGEVEPFKEALGRLLLAHEALATWEQNAVGVEEEDDHHHHHHGEEGGHDHHHHHQPAPQVTPRQMLDIQLEMKTQITAVADSLQTAMEAATNVLKAKATPGE